MSLLCLEFLQKGVEIVEVEHLKCNCCGNFCQGTERGQFSGCRAAMRAAAGSPNRPGGHRVVFASSCRHSWVGEAVVFLFWPDTRWPWQPKRTYYQYIMISFAVQNAAGLVSIWYRSCSIHCRLPCMLRLLHSLLPVITLVSIITIIIIIIISISIIMQQHHHQHDSAWSGIATNSGAFLPFVPGVSCVVQARRSKKGSSSRSMQSSSGSDWQASSPELWAVYVGYRIY